MSAAKFITPPILALLVGCTDRQAPFFNLHPADTTGQMDTTGARLQFAYFKKFRTAEATSTFPFLQKMIDSLEESEVIVPRAYLIPNAVTDVYLSVVNIQRGKLLFVSMDEISSSHWTSVPVDVYLNEGGLFRHVLQTTTFGNIRVADMPSLTLFLSAADGNRKAWIFNDSTGQFENAANRR